MTNGEVKRYHVSYVIHHVFMKKDVDLVKRVKILNVDTNKLLA